MRKGAAGRELSKHYCIAIKYECMDEDIRELIVKFVFQRERTLIQEKRVGWLERYNAGPLFSRAG